MKTPGQRKPIPFFLASVAAALIGFQAFYALRGITRPVDAYHTFFADWGYLIRYWCGQTPGLVMVSRDNGKLQLFHRGDLTFERSESAKESARGLTAAMAPVLKALSAHGVEVVPVLVPTKLSLYRKLLHGDLPAVHPSKGDRDEPLLGHQLLATEMPGKLVDLYESYRQFIAEHPETFLFPPLDYHWTSTGSAIAADSVARRLKDKKISEVVPRWIPAGRQPFAPTYLTDQFPLPRWYVESHSEFQGTEELVRMAEAPKSQGRLILAGTSFSNSDSPFGFAGQLRSAVGRTMVRFSKGNNGYSGAFTMMKESGFQFRRGDIFVWELPLCCLNLGNAALPLDFEAEPSRNISSLK